MRIKDLNKARDDIKRLQDKIANDLKDLGTLCAAMATEVERRYHEEISRADGETDGLEEFEEVVRILKRDQQTINGALGLINNKVRGVQTYNFEEMSENAVEALAESIKGK